MSRKQIKTIGIVGANLTSLMFCQEAKKRGIETILLDKEVDNVASDYATTNISSDFNKGTLERLALRVDAVIFSTNVLSQVPQDFDLNVSSYPSKPARDLIMNRMAQLELATELKIPVPEYINCLDEEDLQYAADEIGVPCRTIHIYENEIEMNLVSETDTLDEILLEVDLEYEMCVVEKIKDYKQVLTITALRDQTGNIVLYPIGQEEEIEGTEQSYINTPASTAKSTTQKIERFTRKLVKYMDSAGIFTFKFGITKAKKLEWLGVTPGVNVGDIHTSHCMQLSVYEQFFNIIEGKKIIAVDLKSPNTVFITNDDLAEEKVELPYHLYRMRLQDQENIQIFVIPDKIDDVEE
ncbi:MAG: hypothetical protein ATN35_07245 [Epulopiscium sp. Nele67-Bin004]|nr:MAG: hypothetical protein ATN35_07245 [Epulopiscium sp. Nele67-Bin004]